MTTPLDKIKSAILGVPFDPSKQPSRIGIVQAFAEMQTQLEGAQAGAIVKATRAALLALTSAPSAGCMAWVTNDSTLAYNGIYENTGTAGTPAWTRRTDIPQFFISGINVGAGTANAIQITTDLPVPSVDGRCLIGIPILETNTASPVTVSINDDTAITIKTNSGNNPAIGGIVADSIILGFIGDGVFRLISDQASMAIVAAAESAQAAAELAQAAAELAQALAEAAAGSASTLGVKGYGATGNGTTDDRAALATADAAGNLFFSAGTYRISSNITFSSDSLFHPAANISIDTGVVVTFLGNVDGPIAYRIFTGLGTVVLSGQRGPVHAEWWGADGDNSTDNAAFFNAMIAALTNGGVCHLGDGQYRFASNVNISNKVDFIGTGRGSNPTVGGTTISPTSAFSTGGTTNRLFTISTGSVRLQNIFFLGNSTTSTAQNYTAIYITAGAGKLNFTDVEIFGCGIGVDFEQGNVGEFHGLSVYAFSVAGYRFGGVANVYSGPWRFFGGVVNNPNALSATTVLALSGTNVLTFTDTTNMSVGMGMAAAGVPAGTTITALTATTVTLSANLTANVPIAAYVRWGWYIIGTCVKFLGNSFDIEFEGLEIAGGAKLVDVAGSAAGAGVYKPNYIKFKSLNATASTYDGITISRGINIIFSNSWIGDVPFGRVMIILGAGNDNSQIDTVVVEACVVGSGGMDGIYCDYMKNFFIRNGTTIAANGALTVGAYNHVYIGANVIGQFEFVNSSASNRTRHNLSGTNAVYGILLAAASLTGGTVQITGSSLGGSAGTYADSSAPTGAQKVIANNITA